jgi:hypothetical protein
MISTIRLNNFINQIDYVVKKNIYGCIVECGVWKGGAICLAKKYLKLNKCNKNVYAFDSFEGLPVPDDDYDYLISDKTLAKNLCNTSNDINQNCYSTIDTFYNTMKKIDLENNDIIIKKGYFEKTCKNFNEKISVLRFDGDWYNSTIDVLNNLYDNIVEGGVLIFDDYNYWNGNKVAVDFFMKNKIKNYNFTSDGELYFIKQLPDTLLCELAYKYKSDKTTLFRHNYTKYYYELFYNMRNISNILEIGIGYVGYNNQINEFVMQHMKNYNYINGASLYMWNDFFPNASIYGIDINKDILFTHDRIKTFFANQNNKADLDNFMNNINFTLFDIIIDDGSHKPSDQIFSLLYFIQYINNNGIYIIEDVKPEFYNNPSKYITDDIKEILKNNKMTYELIDRRINTLIDDDFLIVFKKIY